ncbi:unnamed protein product [Brachyspira suanatina]|uniref:Uncharacterized protein n=1 Tax=Brachyspira suanatina TaxID=381802 RepID=A0A0G4K6X5_9SPIR|nr:hypothetical protein [Brachyspira suanatina]CRF32832.1 unnamed protein product [Brachyspira suanatina]
MTRNEILKIIDEEIINEDENIDIDKLDEYLQLFNSVVEVLNIKKIELKFKNEFLFIENIKNIMNKNNDFVCVEKESIINDIINQNWCHSIYKHYEKFGGLYNILEVGYNNEGQWLLFGIYYDNSDETLINKIKNNKFRKKLIEEFPNLDLEEEKYKPYLYYWYIDAERCNDNDYIKEIADNILKLDDILSNL